MADGYRFPQQNAGNYYYQHHAQPHHPRHQIVRNGTPPNNIRSAFNPDTPSPSRSPDSHSPAVNVYGMFSQGHQQGHGRVNGGPGGRGMPMMYNFQQHQNAHQNQHSQHHHGLQQDHNTHTANGSALGHHSSYSSGLLSNSTPSFTPSNLQNGHTAVTRGGQAQQINEHWAEQLKLYSESGLAHKAMLEQHSGHHYARIKAGENRGITATVTAPPTATQEEDSENRSRPSNLEMCTKRQDWHNMDLSGQGLRVLATPLFNYTFLNELYVASNKISQLPSAIGQLRHLRHLDASNNSIAELPPELGMCVYLKNLLLFDNQLQTLPHALGYLYQLEMLGIEGNPLDSGMKDMVMEKGTKSLIHHLRETAPIPLPPEPRAVLDLQEAPSTNEDRFKVLSWNILCEKAATPQQYGYTPSTALSWEFRKNKILQDIQSIDADFVCLQEVDHDMFKEYLSMNLAYADYKGVFWQRPRSKTMAEKDAKAVDGEAIFYKAGKYILLDKQLIDIANIAINRPDMKGQADVFNRVMPRDHIAVVAFFENRLTGGRIIICNTHLFWDPVFADVKLIQMAVIVENVTKLAQKYAKWPACKDKKSYALADDNDASDTPPEPLPEPAPSKEYSSDTQLPLLICGDFNSTPNSTVYKLLSTGNVTPDQPELKQFKYGNFSLHGIDHPFSLRSAYANLDNTPEALTFTNNTPGFCDVIDHIWYSTNTLENTSLLGPVDPEYLKRMPGFPNYHFPSDHLSMVAEFSVKGRKEKKPVVEPDFGNGGARNGGRGGRESS